MNLSPKLSRPALAALGCAFAFALFYGGACFLQYRAFGYDDFDLAVHTQSIWNLLHGSLDCSILGIPWPGNHANWILALLAPIFALAPSPLTLLFLQSLALALACWPIYLLATRELGDERCGLFFVAAYSFYAPVGHVALFEFHPVAFATPLLLAAFYCTRIGNNPWFVLWSVLAASCQEDVPLIVIALCIYNFLMQREWRACVAEAASSPRRRVSLLLGSIMLAWFLLCIIVIGPHFNHGNIGWTNLYRQFGQSGGEIVRNLFLRPDIWISTLFQSSRGDFLLQILCPFLFLALLAPEVLLIATPSFAQHLLSHRATEQSIEFHYTATLTPLILAAAILGAARLFRWIETSHARSLAPELRGITLFCVGVTLLATNFMYGGFYRITANRDPFRRTALAIEKERCIAQIPPDASVLCTFDTMARFATRPQCHSLHYVVSGQGTLGGKHAEPPPVDYVVVDFADPLTFGFFYHPALPQPDGKTLPSSEQLLQKFFDQHQWHCEYWFKGWAVFRPLRSDDKFLLPFRKDLIYSAPIDLPDGTLVVSGDSSISAITPAKNMQ